MEVKIKKVLKCSIDGCDKKVHASELCTKHNHNRARSGEVAGVYKINLKDKIYIGESISGVYTRVKNERNGLKSTQMDALIR